MKFTIFTCVITLATLANSEILLDALQEIHHPMSAVEQQQNHPTPPFKIPYPPSVSAIEQHQSNQATSSFNLPSPPFISGLEQPQIYRPSPPVKIKGPPTGPQPKPKPLEMDNIKHHIPEFIANIIENLKPKPEGDYFNGKKVPTPKYEID